VVLFGSVAGAAALAILLLAGTVKALVVDHRWVMYSLFIGLTLGGVPTVWSLIGRPTRATWAGAAAGLTGMVVLAWTQQAVVGTEGTGGSGILMLFLAGLAGASAMILPGVSGGYLLLVLGQYIPILGAIDLFKEALRALDIPGVTQIGLTVGLPVAAGVAVGVVGVSNLLRYLLHRWAAPTLGLLLGLLLGAVAGLWPFQEGVPPEPGDMVKGRLVTRENVHEIAPEDYATAHFRPTGRHMAWSAFLLASGFALTYGISRTGRDR
jgi:putative membrane protein